MVNQGISGSALFIPGSTKYVLILVPEKIHCVFMIGSEMSKKILTASFMLVGMAGLLIGVLAGYIWGGWLFPQTESGCGVP
jgi:hypothetical protein